MRLQSKKSILIQQQQSDALGGRVSGKDLSIAKPITQNRLPVIQLNDTAGNIKNTKGTIYSINRLSPFLT